jgi:RHS repeat-associated protein
LMESACSLKTCEDGGWLLESFSVNCCENTFTGKELDDSGLYYFGARYYDPVMGTWLSPDPAMEGLNWYSYCGNNPMNYVDPWGLITESKEQGRIDYFYSTGDQPGTHDTGDDSADTTGGDQAESDDGNGPGSGENPNTSGGQRDSSNNLGVPPEGTPITGSNDGDDDNSLLNNWTKGLEMLKNIVDIAQRNELIGDIADSGMIAFNIDGGMDSMERSVSEFRNGNTPEGIGWFAASSLECLMNALLVAPAIEAIINELAPEVINIFSNPNINNNIVKSIDPNSLHHIFDNPGHHMEGLLEAFGGNQTEAFNAIKSVTQQTVTEQGINGLFQIVVNIADKSITVKGNVINGIAEIGTAFIK